MSISSTLTKNTWEGNGAATSWPYHFRIGAASHVSVILTDASGAESDPLDSSLYTVSGVGEDGGTVVYPLSGDPLPTGWKITLLRRTPRAQETALENQGGLYLKAIEAGLDNTVMMIQELQEAVDRSAKVPVSSPESADALIASVNNAVSATAGLVQAAEAERLGAEAARDASEVARDAAAASAVSTAADATTTAMLVASIPREKTEPVVADRAIATNEAGYLFSVDCSAGDVVVTLPLISAVGEPFPALVKKSDASTNKVRVRRSGSDTVNGSPDDYEIAAQGAGAKLYADIDAAPDNWEVTAFGAAIGDAEPVGFLKSFAKGALPYGYLPRNGSGFLVAAYPDLAALMYVGDANNATASAWYRFTDLGNPTGTRSTIGAYMLTDVAPTTMREVDLGVRAASSGTSLDWDVPEGAERVAVSLYDVSTSGTSPPVIRIGQGAPDTAGYASIVSQVGSATPASASSSAGFVLMQVATAAVALLGRVEIARDADGSFACSSNLSYSSPGTLHVVGRKNISSFDKLRLTTINGTDTFDAGSAHAVAYVPSYDGIPCIKAFGVAATPAEADIAALVAETQTRNAQIAAINSGDWDFTSAEIPIVVGTITVPHGLGAEPSSVEVLLINKVAEAGWTPGQTTNALMTYYSSGSWGVNADKNNTNVLLRVCGFPIIFRASDNQWAGVTPANWRLIVRAKKGTTLTGGGSASVMATDTVIAQGLVEIPHALGKVPTSIDFAYHCINASQGFSVGEYAPAVPWSSGISETASGSPWLTGNGFQVVAATDTLIRVKFANGYSATKTISLLHKDTGVRADVFNADWRITARVS